MTENKPLNFKDGLIIILALSTLFFGILTWLKWENAITPEFYVRDYGNSASQIMCGGDWENVTVKQCIVYYNKKQLGAPLSIDDSMHDFIKAAGRAALFHEQDFQKDE